MVDILSSRTVKVRGTPFELIHVGFDPHVGGPNWRAYVRGPVKGREHVRTDERGEYICYSPVVPSVTAMRRICQRWLACCRTGVWV